jgi:hypothetical protein
VLEAGYGHYPRLAILAAFVTQRPTIAFEPFAYEHFKNVMDIRFKDKEGVLTWKYPEAAEKVKLSAQQKRKRKAAQQNRSAAANGIEDGETSEDEGNHESNEAGDGSNKCNKNLRGDDVSSKRSLGQKGKKSKKTTGKKVTAAGAKKSKKKLKSKKSKNVRGAKKVKK